jgi:hypothetical protein
MERVEGIEPSSRPWEGRILPMNYTRMEPMGGFEPPTFALRKHCSGQLSYIGASVLCHEYHIIQSKKRDKD